MRRDALAAPNTERRTGPGGGRRARLGPDQRTLGGQGGEKEGKGKRKGKGKKGKERERKGKGTERQGRGAALSELGWLVFR